LHDFLQLKLFPWETKTYPAGHFMQDVGVEIQSSHKVSLLQYFLH